MPLSLIVPEKEFFDPATNEFFTIKETEVILEHSLISISKWESKWKAPYLAPTTKSQESVEDYIGCMVISPDSLDDNVLKAICKDRALVQKITGYIKDPMSATFINNANKKPSRETITSELIYCWMTLLKIPYTCENWHLNRLLKLIELCAVKKTPPQKIPKKDIARRYAALNAQRRAKHHTTG